MFLAVWSRRGRVETEEREGTWGDKDGMLSHARLVCVIDEMDAMMYDNARILGVIEDGAIVYRRSGITPAEELALMAALASTQAGGTDG